MFKTIYTTRWGHLNDNRNYISTNSDSSLSIAKNVFPFSWNLEDWYIVVFLVEIDFLFVSFSLANMENETLQEAVLKNVEDFSFPTSLKKRSRTGWNIEISIWIFWILRCFKTFIIHFIHLQINFLLLSKFSSYFLLGVMSCTNLDNQHLGQVVQSQKALKDLTITKITFV